MTDATRRGIEIDSQLDHASPLAAVAGHPCPAGAAPAARRRRRDRPRRDRWRLHRPVDGTAGQGARSRPAGPAAGGRPDRRARDRSQRRLLRGQPDPRRGQRARPVARRVRRCSTASGRENLAGIAATVERYGIDCDFRMRRRADGGHARARGGRPVARRAGLPGRRRGAGAGGLADVPRRPAGPRQLRAGGPRPPRLGAGGRRRVARRPDRGAHPGRGRVGPARPGDGADDLGHGDRRTGGAGHQRVPRRCWRGCGCTPCRSTTTCWPPSRSPPTQLASIGWQRPAWASATPATSSTTTGSPPTTGSSGAATTRSTTSAAASTRRSTTGRATHRAAGRAVLRDVPAARRRPVHAPLGRRHRHVHALLRLLRVGVPRPGRLRPGLHRARRRRLAVRRRRDARSARRRPDGADAAADGPPQAAAVPARAASPTSASSSPAGRWPGRTAPVAATSGCAPLDRLGPRLRQLNRASPRGPPRARDLRDRRRPRHREQDPSRRRRR